MTASAISFALEVSEDFESYDDDVETTLIWRYDVGELVPPVQIMDYESSVGVTLSVNFDVGTGEDGAFNSETYANFSENGDVSGNVITINTEDYPVLKFTAFHLESGWTLRPTGENPLVIYALGNVTIEGAIDCSGEDGEDMVVDGTAQAAGGEGVCGGG
ncbi:MAG: hypothetical protein AAF202_03065, partial [Pseudomonadota bacterium]